MTRAAKYVYSVAVIAGLLLGAGTGYFITFTALSSWKDARRTISPVEFGHFAYAQYTRADTEQAGRALARHAELLEGIQALESKNPNEWSRAFGAREADLGLTYTRLSILADRANDNAASDAYMLKAVVWYSASGRKQQLTAAELKAMVKELDRRLAASRSREVQVR